MWGGCSARYKRGAVVALRASPEEFFHFEQWSGGCVGTARRCIIALDRAKTVRATFERSTGTVRMAVGGPGRVVSDPEGLDCGTAVEECAGSFPDGTRLRLTATADAGGVFDAWGGAVCSGTPAAVCELVVDGDVEVSATFRNAAPDPGSHTLNVIPQEGAHVVSVPAGIDCPELCTAQFASGTRVTLQGVPAEWSGECVGVGVDCILVVDETIGVTARGSANPGPPTFGVNVSVSGPGVVSGGERIVSRQIRCGIATGSLFDCGELFDAGTTVRLKAVPRRGARFARWRGFCSGKKQRCRLRVTAPKTVLAYFRR